MNVHYSDLLGVAVQAASSDSDGDGVSKLALLLLLSGFVFYGAIFLRYRNVNKRHQYESETKARTNNVQGYDTFARKLTGLQNSRMSGANNDAVRGAPSKMGNLPFPGGSLPLGGPWKEISARMMDEARRTERDHPH